MCRPPIAPDMKSPRPSVLNHFRRKSLAVFALVPLALSTGPTTHADTYTWDETAGGTFSWILDGNWTTPGFPNAIGDVANLTTDLAGDQTINLDRVITLGGLTIGDLLGTNFYTLAAGTGGYLVLDDTDGTVTISKTTGGADVISTGLQFNDALTVTNGSAGLLTLSGAMRSVLSNLTFDGTGAGGTTVSGIISTAGNLVKNDSGTVTLGGANTFAGTTTVNAGTLRLTTTAAALPARSAVTVAPGATLEYSTTNTVIGSLSGGGNIVNTGAVAILQIGRDDTNSTFTGRILPTTAANTAITKIGGGTLTLAPSLASTYTGNTVINGGVINLDFANTSLTSLLAATPLQITGGNFTMTGKAGLAANQLMGALTVGATGGAITLVAGDSAGTTLRTGAVTATASGGALLITAPSNTVFQMGTSYAATTLNNRLVFSDGTANTFNWAVNTGANTTTTAFAGYTALPIAGGGLNTTAYNLTASQTQTTAASTIRSLKLGSTGAGAQTLDLDAFNMTLGGAATSSPGAILIDGTDAWNINGATGVLGQATVAGGDLIFHQYNTTNGVTVNAGIANGAGTLNLVKAGPGLLTLAGTNTFTGTVVVAGGTLSFSNVAAGGAGSLGNGSTTAVTIRDGATLRYTGPTGTISGAASTAGAHTYSLPGGNATIEVTTAGQTLTLGGVISGGGGFTKLGAGTLAISAAGTYSGPTFINEGTLAITAADLIPTVPVTIGAAGTLDISAGNDTIGSIAGAGTIAAGATARTLTVGGDNTSTTFSGNFSGAAGHILTKTGVGVLTLANPVTSAWTGGNNVNGGVLRLAASNALSSSGTTNISLAAGPAQLELASGVSQTLGALTFYGTGTTATSQGNVLIGSGATLTLGGNITVNNNSNPLGAVIRGDGTLSLGGTARTFQVNNSTAVSADAAELTISSNITSTAAVGLTKAGNGVLRLAGTNTSTGTNTFQNGTTFLDYSANNTNKLGTGALAMSGGSLVLNGNAVANTSQTVASITLAGGGASAISVNPGGSQSIVLNLGAFTRAAGAGTLRLNLPGGVQSASNGVTTTTPNATSGILGGWATVFDGTQTGFATNSGGNLVALNSLAKDDVSTWLAGDNVTDSTGYLNSTAADLSIGSLRFNASGPSTLTIGSQFLLNIASGGILQTSNVTAGISTLTGGRLTSSTGPELIFTTDSGSQRLEVASVISGSNAITKSGDGTLRLSGNNITVGNVALQSGILELTGGNALGDNAAVVLTHSLANPTLSLLAGQTETIGNLSGGGSTGGTVSIGAGAALTVNQSGNTTFSGLLTGAGTLAKTGAGTLTLDSASTGFSGTLIVNGGRLTITGTSGAVAGVGSITLNGAELQNAQNQTGSVNRIADNATVTLNNTAGTSGFLLTTNQNGTRGDTIGNFTLNAGQNVVTLDATGGSSSIGRLTVSLNPGLSRNNNATALFRGRNLGLSSGQRTELLFTTSPIGGAVGGGGAAGTTTISVFPFLVGQTIGNVSPVASDLGNTFLTYGANGMRPLVITPGAGAEYIFDEAGFNGMSASSSNNVRFTVTPAATLAASGGGTRTINALAIDSTSAGVSIAGPGGDTLSLTAGALLSTGPNPNSLGGFASITTGTSEYVVFTTGSNQLTLGSPLATGAASLTKAGAGTLILNGLANTYGGGTWFNEGVVEAGALGNLGTGNLNFFGGTLRWATGSSYDISARTVSFGSGGATFDTNGNTISLVGTIGGGGAGGLTKTGSGTLTLNAAANWTGTTTVSGGSLVLGVANAVSPEVAITTGGTLDIAGLSPSFTSLTLGAGANSVADSAPAANAVAVTGRTNLTEGSVAPVLAGPTQVVKTGATTATLSNPANTYTGLTWVQNGTLALSRLANAGANSSLGAPTGTDAEIFLGAGTATGTIQHTGTVASGTNRPIVLAGSTGGGAIDSGSSVSGLLSISGRAFSHNAGSKTLTLLGANGTAVAPNLYGGNIEDGYGTVALTKSGAGTWRLTGTNTYSGATTVTGGLLQIQGSVNNSPTGAGGATSIGSAAGTFGLVEVPTGGSLTTDTLSVGANATGVGSLVIRGGSVSTTDPTVTNGISVGTAGYGALLIEGGSFTTNRISLYNSATGTGVFQLSGGTVDNNEYLITSNLRSEFTITGGTLDRNGASQNLAIGYNLAGMNVMNMAGGIVDNTGRSVSFGQTAGTPTTILNLGGGTLITNSISVTNTPTAAINFNGGTLTAAVDSTTFIPLHANLTSYVNGAFGSFAGGAVINSNGRNVTIATDLVAPTGSGVSGLSLGSAGSGYIGAPYVEITGGGGTGATGYAVIDTNPSSGTYGQVTSVVLTNPGVNYTSTPTVILHGGLVAGGTPATISASGLAVNTSGGLTKNGTGVLTLSGATLGYTGTTMVNAGILSITGSTAAAPSTTAITVAGGATLNLFNTVGQVMNSLSSLNLGAGGGTATLGLELGTSSDRLGTTGVATVANAIHFNVNPITGFGIGNYTLLSGAAGSAFDSAATYTFGGLPSGYSYSSSLSDTSVILNVAAAGSSNATLYWRGAVNSQWGGFDGGFNSNWTTDLAGTLNAGASPDPTTTVIFGTSNQTLSGTLATTLDTAYTINNLVFNNQLGSGSISAITIAPGASGSLTITPTVSTSGINLQAGAPSAVTLSAPLVLGAAQTWTVADPGSVLTIGGLVSGGLANSTQAAPATNISLTVRGGGAVDLANTGNTFTGDILVDGGTYRVNSLADWGGPTVASSTSKTITLTNGGTLAVTSGTLNPGALTATTYTLVQIGSGGGTIDVAGGAALQLDDAGQLFGTGSLTKSGAGTLSLRNQGTTYGGFGGTITVTAGIIQPVGGTGFNFGTIAAGTIIQSGAALNVNGITVAEAEPVSIAGTGLAASPAGAITNSSGTGGGLSGPVTLTANATIGTQAAGGVTLGTGATVNLGSNQLTASVASTGAITFNGVVSGSGGSVVTVGAGTGNVVFNSQSIYDGGTTLGGSVLAIPSVSSTPTSAPLTSGPFGTGPVTLNGARMRAGTGAAITLGNMVTIAADTQFVTTASEKNLTFTGAATLSGGTRTLTVDTGNTVAGTAVNFSGSFGDGGGGFGLIKAGTGNLTLSGSTINYTGPTTVNAGTLNISGSGAAPFTSNAITVAGGATLNLLNGSGQAFNLAGLSLGTGSGTTTLGLELGSTSDSLQTSAAASVANTIRFNLTGISGFGNGAYTLLQGGAGSGFNTNATYEFGAMPGGYAYNSTVSDTSVVLNVSAAASTLYWMGGLADGRWNSFNGLLDSNWASDLAGTTNAKAIPGSGSTVVFNTSNQTVPGTLATTLETSFSINDLIFNGQLGSGPISDITIASGAGGSLTLNSATTGIDVQTGAPAVTINPAIALGASQSWNVADGVTTLAMGGAITDGGGGFGFTKTGPGRLLLNSASSTFSGGVTLSSGTLAITGSGTDGVNTAVGLGTLRLNGGTFELASTTGGKTVFVPVEIGASISFANTSTGVGDTLTFSKAVTLVGGTHDLTILATGSGPTIISGAIGDGGSGFGFAKKGPGILALTGANTFTGNLSLDAGILRASGGTNRLGAGNLILNGGTLDINDSTGRDFNRPTTVTANSEIITQRASAGAGVTHGLGTLSIGGQTLTVSGGNVTSGTARLDFDATNFTGAPTFAINNPVGGGVTQLTLGALDNAGFNATVQGNGNLAQSGVWTGAGNLILDSTYSGTVNLSQGNSFAGDIIARSGTLSGSSTSVTNVFGAGVIRLGDSVANANPVLLTTAISNGSIANPIVLGSGTTGTITIRATNSGSGTTYTGGVTGSNNLRLETTNVGGLTLSTGDFDIVGAITNAGTGSGAVTIASNITSNVTNIVQNSATSALNLAGSTIAFTGSTTVSSGTLNVSGSAAAPFTSNAITVAGGATLNLLNGTGQSFNLAGLSLGAGTGTTTLGLELGNTSNHDRLSTTGAATTANTVRFNLTGLSGFGVGNYNLLTAASGLDGATYLLGIAPGGYTYTWNNDAAQVQLQVAAGTTGSMYWRGDVDSSWSNYNGGNTNWVDLGGTEFGSTPGVGNIVIFSNASASGPSISTTLDSDVTIDSLQFTASPVGVTAVTIASGLPSTSSLTITPASVSNGIDVAANAGTVTLSAPVVIGASQEWDVNATGASLLVSGALSGSSNLTKTGGGALTLSADNPAYSGITTVSAGTLNVGSGGATGTLGSGNVVNNAALVFNRTGTFTVSNLISGSGTLTKSASGIMTLDNNSNSFAGPVTVSGGTLAFTSIGDFGGSAPATALGSPTTLAEGTITTTGAATLRFDGASAQSTNRPITSTAGALTLSANGATATDTITYNGAITIGPSTDGSQLVLTGTAGRVGIIAGGIAQTGDTADLTVNGGTWTHQAGTSRIGDDMTVTGASTILNLNGGAFGVRDDVTVTAGATLNLNSTGVLSFNIPTLSGDASLRATNGGIITIGANGAVLATEFDGLRIGVDAGGADGVLNLNANQTVAEFILGNRNLDRSGIVNGTGTLTVTGNLDLYEGTIQANLASTGTNPFEKIGSENVTLSGDNSGLASTGATIVYQGSLILDYTTSNFTKLRAASQLDMRGATLQITGNAGATTAQAVGSLTLAGTGNGWNTLDLTAGSGQTASLSLGAITRAASAGTLRVNLNNAGTSVSTSTTNGAHGLLGGAGFATVKDTSGTWFATHSGGNIAALTSVAKNSYAAWALGDHITDSGSGFTGAFSSANLNSLRFDAAGGSALNLNPGSVLSIASGGILATDQITGGAPGIFGGTLSTGVTEFIVTQDGSREFEIASRINVNNALTKTGNGILRLSGLNTYSGATQIHAGTLQVAGGNGIGDTSAVTLATYRNSTLQLLADETIGQLAGGQRNTDNDHGIVDVGSFSLTINQGAASTYLGRFAGTGTVIKRGASALTMQGVDTATGFTGTFRVDQGLVVLNSTGNQLAGASNVILNGPASSLRLDNDQTTAVASRIADGAFITLNSTAGTTADALGFYMRRTAGTTTGTETLGRLILNSGHNTVAADGTATDRIGQLNFTNATPLSRSNFSTLFVVGRNLGESSGQRGSIRFASAPAGAIGGGGASLTSTISIYPYMVGETTATGVAPSGAANFGNSFVRNVDATVGLKPLDLATEYVVDQTNYDGLGAGILTNNVRFTATTTTLASDTTGINSLVFDHATGITVTGPAQGLQITSGAILSASAGANVIGGFTGLTSANPYYVFVTNPSGSLTLNSALTSAQTLVKSGAGTLVLGANSSVSGVYLNQGILEISDLDRIGGNTGALFFAGGTLRLGAGFTDDLSSRTLGFLIGGGTLDTNGINLALGNSLGSGEGGFTKTGGGNLTLNAAATYTGPTTLATGTITIGASQALGAGGDLTLAGGTTLALGTNSLSHRLVTTSGASPLITGTGTITAGTGFFFNHTGNTQIDAVLSGTGGLLKQQTNTLTLTGANSYSGTTEVRSGILIFNSIGDVGGGASALGNPGNVEDGVIRMGLTTTATTLTYTGTGHNSDRLIGMQGTTGGVTINANGSGALTLGGVRGETPGAKTLTLGGTSAGSLVNATGGIHDSAGTLSVTKSGTNTWAITGGSTYTGNTLISGGGVLRAGATDAFGTTGTVTLQDNDSSLELSNGVTIGNAVTVSDTGNNKVIRLQGGATAATLSGNVTIAETTAGNFDVSAPAGGTLTLSGIISGSVAGGVAKVDAGTVVLTAANTYTGATTVSAGALRISNGSALGTTASGTTVASGAVLELAGAITTAAESLVLNGDGISSGGALRNVTGNNTYAGNITLASAARIRSDADTLTLDVATGNAIAGTDVAVTFAGAGNVVVADAIATGTGGLTKEGAGTLTLSGANTFTGATSVNEGTLIVNGSLAATTNDLTVADNAILSGTGTIRTDAVINGDLRIGTSAANGSVGTLTFTDAGAPAPGVGFGATGTWLVDLIEGTNSSDSLVVEGDLSIDPAAGLSFNVIAGTPFSTSSTYTLATYGGNLSGAFAGWANNGVYTIGGGDYIFSYGTGSNSAITLTAVPEPGTLGLLGLALGGFFFRRLRRRRDSVVEESRES